MFAAVSGGEEQEGEGVTTTESVTSETILREVRARVLTLVTDGPPNRDSVTAWEVALRTLCQVEVIYSQPKLVPLVDHTGDERYQVRP